MPFTAVQVGQAATVPIFALLAAYQANAPVTGFDQCLQAFAGSLGKRLIRLSLAADFGGIDPDQTHTAAIDQAHGVTIDHMPYGHPLST